MILEEYKKLRKALKKVLEEAEQDAMVKGINVSSIEFQDLLLKLKRKILSRWGLTTIEFERLEAEIKERSGMENADIDIALELMAKMRQVEGVVRSVQNLPNVIQEVDARTNRRIGGVMGEQAVMEQRIKQEFSDFVKPPTKEEVMASHDWTDHTELVKDLNDFEGEISKAKKREQELVAEIQRLEKKGEQREQEFNNSLEAVVDAALKLFPKEQYE